MKAMILGAGLGTRLRPYSLTTHKALFTIDEKPVLAIVIEKLKKAGFEAVMINTHHLHQQVETYLDQNTYAISVQTCHEEQILGTGGGIRNIADFWQDQSLLVINADIVCDIDLAKVYAFHKTHTDPVTMVMHDHVRFNCVSIDAQNRVSAFPGSDADPSDRILAFTGIHVLDRRVLDFLPPRGPAHIIDAYQAMINAGENIRAYVVEGHRWHDIGTPQTYQAAVYDLMAPKAFEKAYGHRPPSGAIRKLRLQGDGSDRHWYRLMTHRKNTIIMVDHGIRKDRAPQEADAYVAIGRHLKAKQVSVPEIYAYDRHAGLVFNEDLGDTHLQSLVRTCSQNERRCLYQRVIDHWITMAVGGGKDFDTQWAYQTPRYDTQVVLRNECRYFSEAFVQGYLQWRPVYDELQPEFEQLAEIIMKTQVPGFIHRDFQSRNIMIQNERIGFIDFQGGRLGPIQYDLASLLIDPYAGLSTPEQLDLLTYAIRKLEQCMPLDAVVFRQGYACCAVSRNLQILGAYAYLSRNKGKTQFEAYIPGAAKALKRNLTCLIHLSLPKLEKLADQIIQQLKK